MFEHSFVDGVYVPPRANLISRAPLMWSAGVVIAVLPVAITDW